MDNAIPVSVRLIQIRDKLSDNALRREDERQLDVDPVRDAELAGTKVFDGLFGNSGLLLYVFKSFGDNLFDGEKGKKKGVAVILGDLQGFKGLDQDRLRGWDGVTTREESGNNGAYFFGVNRRRSECMRMSTERYALDTYTDIAQFRDPLVFEASAILRRYIDGLQSGSRGIRRRDHLACAPQRHP